MFHQKSGSKSLKILLRAAIMAASFATISSAYAGEGDGTTADTAFTLLPGVVAQASGPNDPSSFMAQDDGAASIHGAHSQDGIWLFPAHLSDGDG
jgi:hypothetical protein